MSFFYLTTDSIARAAIWFIMALACCAAILAALLRTGLAWRLATDIPNDRSLHMRPTPRVGGWGVVPVALTMLWLAVPGVGGIVVAAAALALLSQIDDRRGLPARVRFVGHVVAVALVLAAYPAGLPWWALAATGFLMVWLVNLYNFMDGIDGLAGGMALFGFGGYALAAMIGPQYSPQLALGAACIVGAAAGFLLFNFHPARIFLGDAGSITLGFLAGAFGFFGWRSGVWPAWLPVQLFSPFIADASVTLLRRLLRGDKFWQAHREHYYQRMVRMGLGHARTAWCWYAVMGTGIIAAIWALRLSAPLQWAVVVSWYGLLAAMALVIDARWRRFQTTVSK
ncbi:MraY family glycosyltransferase [Burkholderia ubonensis]|uniref:MraY family glycosyltransferase n=1 Tax=Burkholderia ubonensis TaxID=101571 RepID=UPI0007562190|nr:glycosyl transferase [Burkholderia ubonensis]KVD57844.1 glycosyl transferase [Burkholderia ubonensis]KVM68198.1 glycosyl transferase [Burkholderia ubonensis]KVN43576.1 glycosyl transferase [Burkholderia ubonensis]KVQ05619.1 glycosyl transferase [Burkholderia ubonensis]